jgi:hypothetical protein
VKAVYDRHQWVIKEIWTFTVIWVCLKCGEEVQVGRQCKRGPQP